MIIFGLGSNIGDRAAHLQAAVGRLAPLLTGMRVSRVLEAPALLPEGAPADWDMPFLNMAVAGETQLAPQEMLDTIKAIESSLGRVTRGCWGPREIDIDILAMDDVIFESANLHIPHQGLLTRDFALLPLAEVAPHWRYPLGEYKGMTAREIAAARGFAVGGALTDKGMLVHAH